MAFPQSPQTGDQYKSGNATYTWDGTKWTTLPAGSGANFVVGATGPQGEPGNGITFGNVAGGDIKIRGRNLGTILNTSQGRASWTKAGNICTIVGIILVNTPFFSEPEASELVVLSFADDPNVPNPTDLSKQPFSLLGGSINMGAERDPAFQDKIVSYRLKTETTSRPDFNFYAETKESNARFELNADNFLRIKDIRTSSVSFNITYVCS